MNNDPEYLESMAFLRSAMDRLTYRERMVLKLRYGLEDGFTYTLEECGRVFKLNRERIRQIEANAIRKLGSGSSRTLCNRAMDALPDYEDPPVAPIHLIMPVIMDRYCIECGEKFIVPPDVHGGHWSARKYCSHKCKYAHDNQVYRAKMKGLDTACPHCGRMFRGQAGLECHLGQSRRAGGCQTFYSKNTLGRGLHRKKEREVIQ